MNSACEHPIRITCSHSDFPVFGLRPKRFFSGPRLVPCLSPSPEKTVARCFRAPESRRRFRVSRQSLVPRWRFHADSRVLCLTGVSLHVPGDLSRRSRPCRHFHVCGPVPACHPTSLGAAPPPGNNPPVKRAPGPPCAPESRLQRLPRTNFAERHNDRESNTIDQPSAIAPDREEQTIDILRPAARGQSIATPRRRCRSGD